MRIGIIGGTFDPPHYAHLLMAEIAREQLRLDRVWWAVTGVPPHKRNQHITPVKNRIEMVKCAIRDNRGFDLSLVDVERPGPHFTVDMLAVIHQNVASAELVLLLGSDSLGDLPGWHEPSGLLKFARIGVMNRPGVRYQLDGLDKTIPGLSSSVDLLDAPLVDISSSQIREWISKGKTIRYMLPDAVHDYIRANHLYGG